MNVQFLFKDGKFSVIECNLRASRSLPYVTKTYDVDFIGSATKIFLGEEVQPNPRCDAKLRHFCVKAPQFSFMRIHGCDPVLSVEMASTGEVACYGRTVHEAFLKAMLSVHNGFRMPTRKRILLSGNLPQEFGDYMARLQKLGFTIVVTPSVAAAFKGLKLTLESIKPEDAIVQLKQKKFDFTINIPQTRDDNDYPIRRTTVDFNIPLITNLQIAQFIVESLEAKPRLEPVPYSTYLEPEL